MDDDKQALEKTVRRGRHTRSASNGGARNVKQLQKSIIADAKFHKKLKKVNRKRLGFTNKLAIWLIFVMIVSLAMGFYLAVESIAMQYTGALVCFTACVAPLDTCLAIVIAKVVDKSKAENLGPDGTGISFAAAQATNFNDSTDKNLNNSPAI